MNGKKEKTGTKETGSGNCYSWRWMAKETRAISHIHRQICCKKVKCVA